MNILFVCTGNTCRSPMAQCLMDNLAKQQSLSIITQSAGISPWPGQPASSGACTSMKAMGLSLNNHQAKPITEDLINWADIIFCMTMGHKHYLSAKWPALQDKIVTFSEPIQDPYGQSDHVYLRCAQQLDRLMAKWAKNAGFF